MGRSKKIKLVIDEAVLERYNEYYFSIHTRAKKPPIKQPYHESINQWMILRRPMMNALKAKWKDFIKWFIDDLGCANLKIERCEILQTVYFPNNRRHDIDNTVPKFILDGFVESGFIVDDDCLHIEELRMRCHTNQEHPRTEFEIKVLEG